MLIASKQQCKDYSGTKYDPLLLFAGLSETGQRWKGGYYGRSCRAIGEGGLQPRRKNTSWTLHDGATGM